MNTAYVLNKMVDQNTSLNSVSEVQSGKELDITNASTVIVRVTGDFVGKVIVGAKAIDNTTTWGYWVENLDTGVPVKTITKSGLYLFRNCGYKTLSGRLAEWTSGTVTVDLIAFIASPTFENRKKNVEIANALGVSVEAGAYTKVIDRLDISEYPFQYVTVRADSKHDFTVGIWYCATNVADASFPSTIGDITILSGNQIRGYSEWVEAKGTKCEVYITNKDTVAHTYDLFLFGVR